MNLWKIREAKRNWAANNPDKVRRANKTYRQIYRVRTNAQAAARMRRYRQRLRVMRAAQR